MWYLLAFLLGAVIGAMLMALMAAQKEHEVYVFQNEGEDPVFLSASPNVRVVYRRQKKEVEDE